MNAASDRTYCIGDHLKVDNDVDDREPVYGDEDAVDNSE